jgi:ActR/RegA family two-component response regulator
MTRPDEITEAFKSIIADCEAIRRRAEHALSKIAQADTITEAKQGQPRSIWTGNVTPLRDYPDNSGDVA